MWRSLLLSFLLLTGCTQIPPTPRDIQAKKFETLPDKAAIYVVRNFPDIMDAGGTINLDDTGIVTTYPGTYYRWEVAPGTHTLSGYAGDAGRITIKVEAGRLYFVEQQLMPSLSFPQSWFRLVADAHGRAIVGRAVLVGQ